MGEINLTDREINAIKAIDERELSRLIGNAVQEERIGDLYRMPLSDCGPYVATKLSYFEVALRRYREAKSARKREETNYSARRAGDDLLFALRQMKRRMETEEQNRQFFHVDDHVYWPHDFTNDLSVTVSYRWRKSVEDDSTSGNITFHHKFVPTPSYLRPQPKRKPSAAKQAQERQMELSSTWESLMRTALSTLRDYFQDGGDGSKIPQIFQAKADPHTGGLNNFSARFWGEMTVS